MILKDTSRFTSSRVSGDGPSRLSLQDGKAPCGRVPVPVSRSPRLGAVAQTEMPIFGPHGGSSSLQADLELSLVSRLPTKAAGSIASAMIWEPWITKSGRRFCRLAASAKTISDLGFSLSATPTAKANQNCPSMRKWPGCRDIEVSPDEWGRRMGYPSEWLDCAPTEMPSSRRSRRNS